MNTFHQDLFSKRFIRFAAVILLALSAVTAIAIEEASTLEEHRRQALAGDADAQAALGSRYDFGQGVPVDSAEAVKWYRLAAAQGHAGAQYNLGAHYGDGIGVPENDAEAVKWYELAANQGYAIAQSNLAVHYNNGWGVPENDVEAAKWFRLAADQGNAMAQINLGVLYSIGEGVPKSDAEAVKWYQLAADQGDALAQYNLGWRYANGGGIPQNDSEAYFWMSLAAAKDSQWQASRDAVRARLLPEQVAQVQARTAIWQPKAQASVSTSLSPPEQVKLLSPTTSKAPSASLAESDEIDAYSIDTATTTTAARLRDAPSGTVVLSISEGSILALIEREARDGWLQVIDVDSGTQGWMHESVLRIHLAEAAPAASIFNSESTGADTPPEVRVGNRSARTIWLRVGDRTHTIAAKGKLGVEIPAGTYRYIAWAPGVIPSIGSQTFERGNAYTWEFWIETRWGVGGRRKSR